MMGKVCSKQEGVILRRLMATFFIVIGEEWRVRSQNGKLKGLRCDVCIYEHPMVL